MEKKAGGSKNGGKKAGRGDNSRDPVQVKGVSKPGVAPTEKKPGKGKKPMKSC